MPTELQPPEVERMESIRKVGWNFARQAVELIAPHLESAPSEWRILDAGCGIGFTSLGLARLCREVVGVEPSDGIEIAFARLEAEPQANLTFRREAAEEVDEVDAYDAVLLDNVFEHVAKKREALAAVTRALKPGGVLLLIVPNLLWPIEHHYGLPFLGWMPLKLANLYLRITKRGTDFTECSYGVTYFGMRRHLQRCPELTYRFVTPAQLSWTTAGTKWHYRWGVALLKRFPFLWCISKSFLIVAKKAPEAGKNR